MACDSVFAKRVVTSSGLQSGLQNFNVEFCWLCFRDFLRSQLHFLQTKIFFPTGNSK